MSVSGVLAVACWSLVVLATVAGVLWDRIERVAQTWRHVRRCPVAPVPASVARARMVDPFSDPLERAYEAPCAPDPDWIV